MNEWSEFHGREWGIGSEDVVTFRCSGVIGLVITYGVFFNLLISTGYSYKSDEQWSNAFSLVTPFFYGSSPYTAGIAFQRQRSQLLSPRWESSKCYVQCFLLQTGHQAIYLQRGLGICLKNRITNIQATMCISNLTFVKDVVFRFFEPKPSYSSSTTTIRFYLLIYNDLKYIPQY